MHVEPDEIVDGVLPAWHPYTGRKLQLIGICWRFPMELLCDVLQKTSTIRD